MTNQNEKKLRDLLKPYVSDWMFDDGNNKLLWKDKAPTVNQVLDVIQKALEEERKKIVKRIKSWVNENKEATGDDGCFYDSLSGDRLCEYLDDILKNLK